MFQGSDNGAGVGSSQDSVSGAQFLFNEKRPLFKRKPVRGLLDLFVTFQWSQIAIHSYTGQQTRDHVYT